MQYLFGKGKVSPDQILQLSGIVDVDANGELAQYLGVYLILVSHTVNAVYTGSATSLGGIGARLHEHVGTLKFGYEKIVAECIATTDTNPIEKKKPTPRYSTYGPMCRGCGVNFFNQNSLMNHMLRCVGKCERCESLELPCALQGPMARRCANCKENNVPCSHTPKHICPECGVDQLRPFRLKNHIADGC